MSRRTSLASLAGQPVEAVPGLSGAEETPAVPVAAPPVTVESATAAGLTVVQRIPLAHIAPTPLNSRKDFGSDDELREFGTSILRNQLQAVVVVPRADYLALWPEHDDQLAAKAAFVLAAGERRYRGLSAIGGTHIDAVSRPELASSQLGFLDALFTENFARKNLDAIEEANAIEELVKVLGTAKAVAEHYGKSEGWASQRRTLLRLTMPMQRLVSRGELPIETARALAKLPPSEQEDTWLELKSSPAARRKKQPASEKPKVFTAVKPDTSQLASERQSESSVPGNRDITAVETAAGHGEELAAPASNQIGFTGVKPTSQSGSDSAAPVPAPREGGPVVVSIDRSDLQAGARAIREALSVHESYALVKAIIESLRDDPDFATVG